MCSWDSSVILIGKHGGPLQLETLQYGRHYKTEISAGLAVSTHVKALGDQKF